MKEDDKAPAFAFDEVARIVPDGEITGHGGIWKVFTDHIEDWIDRNITPAVQEGSQATAWAANPEARPLPMPASEPESLVIQWPDPTCGVAVVVELGAESGAHEVVSLYPFLAEGVGHSMILDRVRLWPGRLEACLEGRTVEGGMNLAFFDAHFAANRAFYRKDGRYRFVLTGFPYSMEKIEAQDVVIDDPGQVARMRAAMYPDDPELRDSGESVVVSTSGMAALVPGHGRAPEIFEFQGPVKDVRELAEPMLEQRTWVARVTVARPGDRDFDLDLCLTEKVLGQAGPPQKGDDVRGMIRLQGYLWSPED